MSSDIQIVDRGRGLQLSTSRITVQDLVPYFQRGCSYDEIIRWIPTLSREEIAVVERYYHEHKDALDEEDRRLRAYRERADSTAATTLSAHERKQTRANDAIKGTS